MKITQPLLDEFVEGLAVGSLPTWAMYLNITGALNGIGDVAPLDINSLTQHLAKVSKCTIEEFSNICVSNLLIITNTMNQCSLIDTNDNAKCNEPIDAYNEALLGYIIANEMKHIFSNTEKQSHIQTCLLNSYNIGALFMFVGQLQGIISATRNFKHSMSSQLGRNHVKGRWDPKNTLKTDLVKQAEAKWIAGSLLLHDEMADELIEKNPKATEFISRRVLLTALGPIAKRHGKLRGAKGVRKEKTPPQ